MVAAIQPRFEFRIFGTHLEEVEGKILELSPKEKTREMRSVYLLAAGNPDHNIKIREGIMDIKTLEQKKDGLEQWSPFLVGEFPLKAEVIKSVVFPALGTESPVFDREEYSLQQFIDELITVDPDISIAYVCKKRHAFTISKCITEVAEIKVNGATIKTICIEAEDPKKVLKAKKKLHINEKTENVNYPLALKRIMGLVELPEYWQEKGF
jgi:exopolyphosphatase/guanosine-5'-triphosphate,3'-diphosphate pyrophosphatase